MVQLKKVIYVLLALVVVGALVSLPFVTPAQRLIIGMGAALGVVNLLGLLYFLGKHFSGSGGRH